MIKPAKVLLFFLLVGAFLLPVVLFMPAQGVKVGPFTLKMLSMQRLLGIDTVHYADISKITATMVDIDTISEVETLLADSSASPDSFTMKKDTIRADAEALKAVVQSLEMNEEGKKSLFAFFRLLRSGLPAKEEVRILHYGDSQIEGDRISSYLRDKLQKKFGGFGPGLLPALQPYNSYFSVMQSNEGPWQRYALFGNNKDVIFPHKYFGLMAAYTRFSPYRPDSLPADTLHYHASISFDESPLAYHTARKFKKLMLLYGHTAQPLHLEVYNKEQLVQSDTLINSGDYKRYTLVFPTYVQHLKLKFDAVESPDIYAVGLSDTHGVAFDNIGMRGSSGLFFTKMDITHLKKMYDDLNVRMLILQFGGNVLPYVKDSAQVEAYARHFKNQLLTLKNMKPSLAIVVVGPSDMSTKIGQDYLTYPLLPYVVDRLRQAALSTGCSYWDMYAAMGGYNSMPAWVMAKPALAGSDYTHFTPRGAKLIANMFYNALMLEYHKAAQNSRP